MKNNISSYRDNDIAVIGMECLMPQSQNISEFWEHIAHGKDLVSKMPKKRYEEIGWYLSDKLGIKSDDVGAYLNSISEFDPEYYQISIGDAILMDPCQRLLLDTIRRMLEKSCYDGELIYGTNTGIFIGRSGENKYESFLDDMGCAHEPALKTGNENSLLTGRISYIYNLKGPNMVIDTACSSSLHAIHLACKSIQMNECSMAIAGGVQVHIIPHRKVKIGIESSTSRTRSFDINADGTGSGEGIGVVLLKPALQAIKDEDKIYAIIKGSAINHDGTSAGLSAPNPEAQSNVIKQAWEHAGIDPCTVSYIEAHGTGTKIGDPLEIEGIRRAFSAYTQKRNFCYISSVKSNVGHLDSAAGIAGFLKAVCSLQYKLLAPTVHYTAPNPQLDIENSPVYLSSKPIPWDGQSNLRRCGVSSFSINGSNCHIVMEEYNEVNIPLFDNHPCLFVLSAKTPESLKKYLNEISAYLDTCSTNLLNQICYSISVGRKHHFYRVALIVESIRDLKAKIDNLMDTNLNDFEAIRSINSIKQMQLQKETMNLIENTTMHWKDKLGQIANLYMQGVNIKFSKIFSKCQKVSLPTYPTIPYVCWPKHLDNKVDEPVKNVNDETVEQFIYRLFQKSLSTDLSTYSNFYDIGGDSINAIEIIAKINERYNTNMIISDLLENSDIKDFIEFVEISVETSACIKDSKIQTDLNSIPLSYIQRGIFIQEFLLGDDQKQNYGMYSVIDITGDINVHRLEYILNEIIAEHKLLRGIISIQTDKPIINFRERVDVTLQYLECTHPDDVQIFNMINKPFDMLNGILYWFLLVKEEENKYRLYTAIHHILVDGISISILIEELFEKYENIGINTIQRETINKKASYSQYVLNEMLYINSEKYCNDEQFWMEMFKEQFKNKPFPCDCENEYNRKEIISFPQYMLPNGCSKMIVQLATHTKTTRYSILLAAYVIALAIYSQSDDVILGTIVNDRIDQDFHNIIGPMIKTVPIRSQLLWTTTIKAYIQQIHQQILDIHRHIGYPLESLVEKLHLSYNSHENPLFDTVFAYQNTDRNLIRSGQLEARIRYYEKNNTQFKVFINVYENIENEFFYTMNYNKMKISKNNIDRFSLLFKSVIDRMSCSSDILLSELRQTVPDWLKNAPDIQ